MVRPYRPHCKRRASATLFAAALTAAPMAAAAGDNVLNFGRPTSGEGVPPWVVRDCRPATGAEIMGRFAGAGYWFYRTTGDFCYFDRRPNVL
jgi:hypothetical protein